MDCLYCKTPFREDEIQKAILIRDGSGKNPDINAAYHESVFICNQRLREKIVELTKGKQPEGDGWEENVKYLLDKCPYAIRVREGGGPENLLSSLVVTFMGMQDRLK